VGIEKDESMNDELFNWDDANILHLAEHGVMPEETEEVILSNPLDTGFDVIDGEDRWAYVGETGQGRILRIVITLRGERIRVVTAFEAPKYWKAFYLEQRGGLP
jgi:uncharacterized protein